MIADCGSLGADKAISVEVENGTDNYFGVLACLRGPNLAAGQKAVRAMLDSTSF